MLTLAAMLCCLAAFGQTVEPPPGQVPGQHVPQVEPPGTPPATVPTTPTTPTTTSPGAPVLPSASATTPAKPATTTPTPVAPPGETAKPGAETPTTPARPATGEGPKVPPGTEGPKPPAIAPEDQVKISAEHVYYQGGATSAQGKVKLEYKDITVQADVAEIDADQVWARCRGHVVIEMPYQRTTGTELVVNLDTEQWELRDGATVVHPAFFRSGPQEDLFAHGKQIEGQPGGQQIIVISGEGTSCDKPQPHYDLVSREIDIRPAKKIIFHQPTLELEGHSIIKVPFNVTLSLEETRSHFLPEVGKNDVEGYFVKFGQLYSLGDSQSGVAKLSLTQKRGIGFGLDHLLQQNRQNLQASIMFQPKDGSITGTVNDRMQWSQIFSSQFNTSIQRNSGYGGVSTTSISSDLTFRRTDLTSTTELGFQKGLTSGTFSTGSRFQTSFSHEQRIGENLNWRLQSVLRSLSFAADQPPDENLETNFELNRRSPRFDTQVLVQNFSQRSSSSSTGGFSFSNVARSPEIIITTDSQRMHNWGPFGLLPVRSQFYLGSYRQPGSDTIKRMGFDADFGRSSYGFGSDSGFTASGKLKQMFYSDGSAQYVAGLNLEQRNKISQSWQTSVRFSHSKPNGFAPLKIDYPNRSSNAYITAVQLLPNRRRLELNSGYDFLSNRYQDVNIRGEFMTGQASKLDLQGAYALDQGQWRPLLVRWVKVVQDARYLSLSSQYDIKAKQLYRADMELDYVLTPKWRLNFLGGYSGTTHTFDFADVRLTRDLHCILATFTYNKSLGEFRVDIGLKAFPTYAGPFGVGRSGSRFEGGAGQYY